MSSSRLPLKREISQQQLWRLVMLKVSPSPRGHEQESTDSHISGTLRYTNAFGPLSLKDGPRSEPLPQDATLWLASCSKLMTAIAAVQCVKRGQFTLDEDVTRLLPELKDIDILKGFEDGTEKPILVKATKKITLRSIHFGNRRK